MDDSPKIIVKQFFESTEYLILEQIYIRKMMD